MENFRNKRYQIPIQILRYFKITLLKNLSLFLFHFVTYNREYY